MSCSVTYLATAWHIAVAKKAGDAVANSASNDEALMALAEFLDLVDAGELDVSANQVKTARLRALSIIQSRLHEGLALSRVCGRSIILTKLRERALALDEQRYESGIRKVHA